MRDFQVTRCCRSKAILAQSCAALTRLLTCACARVFALSRRPKGEIFRAVEPGRENDPLASRGKLQDITPSIPNGFRYEEITRRVKGHAMRIVKTGSERALHACQRLSLTLHEVLASSFASVVPDLAR
jgi:hypothetical protein